MTLSGAMNPSSSPHKVMKDWRFKHKFCSHSGSENSQSGVIYSFVASLGGRGRNVKQRPPRPSLLSLRAFSKSELLPNCCLIVSIKITVTTAQKREETLHLVMRFICDFTPVRRLFWINTCKHDNTLHANSWPRPTRSARRHRVLLLHWAWLT